uniref:Uncharacterized protein n=1 Tax=Timema genevievae TaxID=629358 RepID=A0A7R9JSI5_TIMGE|nr:unnamed protein product [Timema genevievae]
MHTMLLLSGWETVAYPRGCLRGLEPPYRCLEMPRNLRRSKDKIKGVVSGMELNVTATWSLAKIVKLPTVGFSIDNVQTLSNSQQEDTKFTAVDIK